MKVHLIGVVEPPAPWAFLHWGFDVMRFSIQPQLLTDHIFEFLLGNVGLRARLHFTDDVKVVFIARKERRDYRPEAKRSLAVHRRVEQCDLRLRSVQPSPD